MKSREPAGWERGGGSSAESSAQAWAGPGERPPGLSVVINRGGAIRLQSRHAAPGVHTVGRSAVSTGFFYTKPPPSDYTNIWRAFK